MEGICPEAVPPDETASSFGEKDGVFLGKKVDRSIPLV